METMYMLNFGGQTKSIMVFLKVAYSTANSNIHVQYVQLHKEIQVPYVGVTR